VTADKTFGAASSGRPLVFLGGRYSWERNNSGSFATLAAILRVNGHLIRAVPFLYLECAQYLCPRFGVLLSAVDRA
jgi:hypothetical protein